MEMAADRTAVRTAKKIPIMSDLCRFVSRGEASRVSISFRGSMVVMFLVKGVICDEFVSNIIEGRVRTTTPTMRRAPTETLWRPHFSWRMKEERIIVNTGEEKATAEKSPIGSLPMASNTENNIPPPNTAWQMTLTLVLQSSNPNKVYFFL